MNKLLNCGLQITYKELKLFSHGVLIETTFCLQITYKELKRFTEEEKKLIDECLQITYKELKHELLVLPIYITYMFIDYL